MRCLDFLLAEERFLHVCLSLVCHDFNAAIFVSELVMNVLAAALLLSAAVGQLRLGVAARKGAYLNQSVDVPHLTPS